MREIKFRAWDRLNKLMIEEFCISNPSSSVFNIIWPLNETSEGKILTDDRAYQLMQYTGLKDKNGKEIYEGDIVKSTTHHYGKEKQRNTIIKWNDDIENDSFGEPFTSGYLIMGGQWEVIGNIYENKDLNKTKVGL